MAKTPRKWTGARSPSGLKRVRSSARRHEILQPRRSAAKTLVKAALATATSPTNGTDAATALAEAMSALDRAAKVGAIHPNQAARRKSRLALAMNAASGGSTATGLAAKTVSKAQAQKAAKARIAASKADKAKGAQTAAGKARAALHRTTRSDSGEATPAAAKAAPAARTTTTKTAAAKPAAKAPAKAAASKPATAKTTATKAAAAKPAAKAPAKKAPAAKAPATKAPAKKAAKS